MARQEPLRPVAQRMRGWEWGALLLILAVAAFLRLQRPRVVEYRGDEARLSRLALEMAAGETLPLLGIGSSVGVPNPPFSVWVFALPYAVFGNDPVRVTQFVGVLGVLAVLLLFFFARRWFGPAVAIIAATLFATSPWAVIWSRKIWAQDVIPFFVLLTFGIGVLGLLERKGWAQLLFLPLLSITGQIYYATFVLIPAALYLVWAGRRHLGRPFWVGAGVTVLTLVPLAVGALTAWNQLPSGVVETHLQAQAAARDVALSDQVLLRLRDAWGGSGARDFVGGEVSDLVLDGAPDGEIFYEILGVLALIGCAWLVVRAFGRRATGLDRMLALWALATPVAYAFTWTTVWIHYMIPALPLGFLALGVWLHDLSREALFRVGGPRPWIATGLVLLLALGSVQAWSQTSMLGWAGRYHTPGGFGVPLGMRLEVRDDILARAPQRVIVKGAGHDTHEHREAAIWDALLAGTKDVSFAPSGTRIVPRAAVIVLNDVADLPQDLVVHDLRAAAPPFAWTVLSSEGLVTVGVRDPDAVPVEDTSPVDVPGFANGLRIRSFVWEEDHDELTLVLGVDGMNPSSVEVQGRLVGGDGKEIGIVQGVLAGARMARDGDTLVWRGHAPWEEPPMAIDLAQMPPLDPRTIEVRLFQVVKRPGHEERQPISLEGDPNTHHITLRRR